MSGVNYAGYTREEAIGSVGTGWMPLVNRVFDALIDYGHPVKIIQVKEKFGGLRVYTDHFHEEIETVIIQVGNESFSICEECGAVGKLRGTTWYRTLCEDHADGRPVVESDYDEEC